METARAVAVAASVMFLACTSRAVLPSAAIAPAPARALPGRAAEEPVPPVDLVAVVAPAQRQEAGPPPPTWGQIYARYFGPGTVGGCGRPGACHAAAMADADSAYRWLSVRGYIAGPQSPLVGSNSCLRWFGGNMPPRAPASEDAVSDLEAWAAAGARNDGPGAGPDQPARRR